MKYTIDYFVVGVACFFLGAGVFYWLFGLTGINLLIGISICYGIVGLAIFRYLPLDTDEKLFISVFISLGLFPLLVWYIDRLIQSFFISTVTALVIIFLTGLIIKPRKRKENVKIRTT